MQSILIADDDPINLTICKTHLSARYQVATVKSGLQALGYLKEHPMPNLILLDVVMPGVSGLEVLRQIREMEGAELLPVILVTGTADLDVLEHGYAMGASDFVLKPIAPVQLNRTVEDWLSYAQLQRENARLRDQLRRLGGEALS